MAAEYAPLRGDVRCDVAVIGGGFTGLSAGLALAGRGARVCVLEAGAIGGRASGRNGGQVVPGLKPRADAVVAGFGSERGQRMLDFAHGLANRTFALIAEHRIACSPTRNGWIQGAFSPKARDDLKRRAEINAKFGGDVEYVDSERVAELTGTRFHSGGLLERAAGAVHPLKFSRGLAQAAALRGATLYEHSRVRALEGRAGRGTNRWLVSTEHGDVDAEQVILATDGYTDRLWPAAMQSIVNVNSAQLATDPLPPALSAGVLPARAGVSETRKITYYYRIDPEGRFVIGGRGPFSDRLDSASVARIARASLERFPQLAGVQWRHGWACRVAMTLDDLPHLHALAPGLWTALGYGGRGVALAVGLGEAMAQLALGVDANQIDYPVTPLRRVPAYPLRQPMAAAAITYYRIKDRLGFPS
ncbi:MAG: FAD-binding oxidoreductase [Casimicrobiaceae bacterium]